MAVCCVVARCLTTGEGRAVVVPGWEWSLRGIRELSNWDIAPVVRHRASGALCVEATCHLTAAGEERNVNGFKTSRQEHSEYGE